MGPLIINVETFKFHHRMALNIGYDRYFSVNSAGELIGRVEAIRPREMLGPVFEQVGDGHTVFLYYLW